MIPKIIHYCWLSGNPFPDTIKRCMNTWKKKMPDYEFILWDTNKFDINSSIWVKQAFEAKKYAFAADYIRLYAVYNYGGIYLDTDVEVLKDFTPLLNYPYFLGVENEKEGVIEAATFGAEPKNIYIKKCLDYYNNRTFIKSDGSFDTRSLPPIMKECLKDIIYLKTIKDFKLNQCNIQLLPVEYFSPKNYLNGKMTNLTNKTYSIHHFRASWFTKKQKIVLLSFRILGPKTTSALHAVYNKFKNIFKI